MSDNLLWNVLKSQVGGVVIKLTNFTVWQISRMWWTNRKQLTEGSPDKCPGDTIEHLWRVTRGGFKPNCKKNYKKNLWGLKKVSLYSPWEFCSWLKVSASTSCMHVKFTINSSSRGVCIWKWMLWVWGNCWCRIKKSTTNIQKTVFKKQWFSALGCTRHSVVLLFKFCLFLFFRETKDINNSCEMY